MKFQIALLALVALGPRATAAQITASPYILQTDPAQTIASAILNPFADRGFSAYDYLVVAAPGVVISTPDEPSKIPTVALVASGAVTIWFFALLALHRWAVRPSHRIFSRRGKRILRKMSHI